jgi:nucleotide-binding universal stress UspA family protein
MYKHILIALENRPTDEVILQYIRPLVRLTGAKLILTHVADGFVARHQDLFNLQDSPEIIGDREYLDRIKAELTAEGFVVSAVLTRGKPAEQIVQLAHDSECDLIAMSTHGHKFIGDLVFGSVASTVRHLTDIPVLLVPARQARKNQPRTI